MPDPALVYIVDDDEPVRTALGLLLETAGFKVRSYGSGTEFLRAVPTLTPGCIVSDVRMPGMDGLELHKRLLEIGVDLPFIVMTGHADVPMAIQALKNGAADFIEKPFYDEIMIAAIHSALDIGELRSHGEAAAAEIESRIGNLTPREHDILDKLVGGLANSVIAAELQITTQTVEIHRAAIMKKMQARSLSELIRLVLMSARLGRAGSKSPGRRTE